MAEAAAAAPVDGDVSSDAPSVIGQRVHTPCTPRRNMSRGQPSNNTYDLIHLMMMWAKLEDERCNNREEREERRALHR